MINFRKAGLLIITLVIPALVFVFLKLFATNHYDLPHYFPQLDASGKVVKNNADTLFYNVPDITLNSTGGQVYTEKFGDGKITVASYLPPDCNESCKVFLGQMERIFALRESIPNLNLVTIAENWQGNSTEYPAGINSEGWKVLTGSAGEVEKVIKETLKLETKVPEAKTNSLESKLVLVDSKGQIRGYYDVSDSEETDRLMAEIKILDYEKKSN